ncbi:MAG TPA: hypothetical protein VFJ57_03935 [Solirubrobacterales bacterium]|nr:hypothetical protein [Solirubrobacterales bacterium]
MGAVRIRWRALAKVMVIAVGVVLALQALPGLLQPPAPPPLAKDVGLRGVVVERDRAKRVEFLPHTESKSPRPRPERASREPLAPDVISSVPHPHLKLKAKHRSPKPRGAPPPAAASAPEPPLAAAPPTPIEPPPPPPPPPPAGADPPADGSEEFAPH